jgi:two-component system sensor histidine kinase RegB
MIVDRHLALRWVVWLRYGLIAGEIALILGLSFGIQIGMPLALVGSALFAQGISNWLLGITKERLGSNAEHLVGGLFVLDTLCLTLILALSGGPPNSFSLLYLVQITFSAVVLRELWT